jgi:proline dehydrogenase
MDVEQSISFRDTSIAFSSKSDKALRKMYWLFRIMNNQALVNLGSNLLKIALRVGLPVKPLIRRTVFELFCGGETIYDCRQKSLELHQYGIGTILDYSVEGSEDESDMENTSKEILEVVEKSEIEPRNPFAVFKFSGIASNLLMEKLQRGDDLTQQEWQSWKRTRNRMESICKACYTKGIQLLIDAEETWIQDVIDQFTYEMMEKYNGGSPIVFNTYQMYRRDMYRNLVKAHELAVEKNYYLGVKLVRGAYMEKERDRALDLAYEDPIQPNKQASDDDFNKALEYCVQHLDRIALCCGSHNEYSNLYLTKLMENHGIARDDQRICFAQLYGMSDNISFNLSNAGYNVAKYLPYGPVEKVIPYLIRRAEENTAIAGQTSREYSLIKKEIARRAAQRPN